VRWFSSYNKFTGRFPSQIISDFGEPKTLAQGRNRVDEQFSYLTHPINAKEGGMYAVFFTMSFALFAFVFEDASQFEIPDALIHLPFD
jgi:hypothetical protein